MREERISITSGNFTDDRHPLACYGKSGDLDQERMHGISERLEEALGRIQASSDLRTRAELAEHMGVGKNEPRNWLIHPEKIRAHNVNQVCELSGCTLEELRYGTSDRAIGILVRGEALQRFTADELAIYYDSLSDEQKDVITRMAYEMTLANRLRSRHALN